MATETTRPQVPVTVTGRIARWSSRLAAGKDALKGELLSAASNLWFLLFILLPTLIVVFFGFTTINPDLTVSYSRLTLSNFQYALAPYGIVVRLTLRTMFVSVITAIGALIISYPIAYYLARLCSEKYRGIIVSLVVIPFWISFVVQVYAMFPWVQRDGYIGTAMDVVGLGGFANWLFSTFGYGTANIVAPALIYIWLPFMVLPLFTSILNIDPSLLEAAQDLGAGKWKTFWHVTVPLSYNGVLTGTILIFITAFGSFVEPKLLAGEQGTLVGNYIQDAFLKFGYLPIGAAASIVVLIPTILLLYVYVVYAEKAFEERREGAKVGLLARIWNAIRSRVSDLLESRAGRAIALPSEGNGVARMQVVRGRLERFYDRLAARHGKRLLQLFTGLILAAFYVPLAQVVVFSFNHDYNIINWSYFSLRWWVPSKTTAGAGASYTQVTALFGDADMMAALLNSLFIGLAVTGMSLLTGVPAAMAIARYKFSSKRFLDLMLYTSLVMPSIIMGVSILVFITFLDDLYLYPYLHTQWLTGYLSIIVGQTTFTIPIVIVTLVISFREFDRSVEEAAMNLGADEITTFLKVTFPIVKPGIISAALLAFTFSFSDVVVALFLKGGGVNTMPVLFWSYLSRKIPTPELNAASTLILGLSILFVLVSNRVQKGGLGFRF